MGVGLWGSERRVWLMVRSMWPIEPYLVPSRCDTMFQNYFVPHVFDSALSHLVAETHTDPGIAFWIWNTHGYGSGSPTSALVLCLTRVTPQVTCVIPYLSPVTLYLSQVQVIQVQVKTAVHQYCGDKPRVYEQKNKLLFVKIQVKYMKNTWKIYKIGITHTQLLFTATLGLH